MMFWLLRVGCITISTLLVLLLTRIYLVFKTLNPTKLRRIIQHQMAQEPSVLDDQALWRDVEPIPQPDTERPLVPINYQPKYRNAMDMFRGLLKKNEYSPRGLKLTTEILQTNPSHYPVWSYRLETLKHLHQNEPDGHYLDKELELLNKIMPKIRKSYQAWLHRTAIISLKNDPSGEIDFINETLKHDYKNYHTWSYRQDLLCKFNLPKLWQGELGFVDGLLETDPRNNSTWNHRFFLVFESIGLRNLPESKSSNEFDSVVQKEVEFCKGKILIAPNNPSAWNYLRGVLKRGSVKFGTLTEFVIPMTKTREALEEEGDKASLIGLSPLSDLPAVPAVEFLADIYSEDQTHFQSAVELFKLLAEKLDPIREGYWTYRSQFYPQLLS